LELFIITIGIGSDNRVMIRSQGTKSAEPSASQAIAATWRPVAGFTWELFFIAFAWVICFAMIPATLFWMKRGAHPSTLFWIAFWGYFALTYKLTSWLSDRYRQRQRKNLLAAEDLLKNDTRPHVLYLRSFKDDQTTSRLLNLSTEEQELAVAMLDIGPFIAFGEPGEEAPEPGAARMYVAHERWRNEVRNLITNARLVVGRIANSPSFWWEIATAKEIVTPERLLLLLPESENEYEEFKRWAIKVFPRPLPAYQFRRRESHISSEGLIYFKHDWTPHLLPFKTASLRQNYWAPGVPILITALKPVYDQLGIAWRRPPLQPIMLLAVVLLFFVAAFVLYIGALQVIQLVELVRRYL
jgi:hypothetical protein